jgi:hypothetical protein
MKKNVLKTLSPFSCFFRKFVNKNATELFSKALPILKAPIKFCGWNFGRPANQWYILLLRNVSTYMYMIHYTKSALFNSTQHTSLRPMSRASFTGRGFKTCFNCNVWINDALSAFAKIKKKKNQQWKSLRVSKKSNTLINRKYTKLLLFSQISLKHCAY